MSFQTLFYPETIAVIGASSRAGTVGNDLVKNLIASFKGKLIPINPKIDELYGLPVVHDIKEVDDHIDLAVIAIPAPYVSQAIEAAAQKGATAAIVISAGFKEAGNKDLERELTKVCQDNHVTLIGPNCLGVINPSVNMNASFAGQMPQNGNVAFISQSGALCTAVLDYAAELGIGFSKFLSIGNKAVVDEIELLNFFATDPDTQVIAMYTESLIDAPRFIDTAKNILHGDNPKPIVVIKSGKTAEGAGAIASHTGSLAGGDAAYEALFKQAGVIRANTVSELFELIQLFSVHPVQQLNHVAIITNAGGPGVLTTDALVESGVKLAHLSDTTMDNLRSFLPLAANVHNPVDILGDALADRYADSLTVLAADPDVDGILLILTPQSMTQIPETAAHVISAGKTTTKPIAVSFMGKGLVKTGITTLRTGGVVASEFPEPLAYGFGQMSRLAKLSQLPVEAATTFDDVDQAKVRHLIDTYISGNHLQLPEAEAIEILKAYKFPTLNQIVVKSETEAAAAALQFSGEVVLKIVSQDILHKSDVGGVRLRIAPHNIACEFSELMAHIKKTVPEARIDGVLVVEMAPQGGSELILGINKTPGLGTMLMVGLGGIYVEVFKDVVFRFAPLTQTDAREMIDSLKTKAILEGARGSQPVNKDKVVECIMRLSQLVIDFPEIVELDINPLLAHPEKALVLDARIVLEK